MTTLYAETVAEDTLIDTTEYEIAGTFAPYDFKPLNDKSPFDWVFTASDAKVYQMHGNEPTDENLFGWKLRTDIDSPTPQWHMFQADLDANGKKDKFEWVLLFSNTNEKHVYTLQGVDEETGTFKYVSDPLDIDYKIEGKKILTAVEGTFGVSYVPKHVTDALEDTKGSTDDILDQAEDITDKHSTEANDHAKDINNDTIAFILDALG